jgi:sulfate/thiosulfate transport system ATP-binding protein
MSIKVEHLTKRFGGFTAVDDVSFEVASGELVALLGPSGGGKSTILRIVSGLEHADEGAVYLDGRRVNEVATQGRRVGFVFQHYALFRHMNVAENVAFGLKVRKVPKKQQVERTAYLLDLMGLHGLDHRFPHELSGGQRQRVALARALAPEPGVLLLDEPFGAVDAKVREELRQWLRRLHDEVHVTSIFVTHDQEEAFAVSDRIVVIRAGKLEQEGTPAEILDAPATEFMARFVGEANVFDGVVRGSRALLGPLEVPAASLSEGDRVRIVIRIYDLKFWREDPGVATVRKVILLGDRVRVEAELDRSGETIFAQFPRRSSLLRGVEPGCRIQVEVTSSRVYPAT